MSDGTAKAPRVGGIVSHEDGTEILTDCVRALLDSTELADMEGRLT